MLTKQFLSVAMAAALLMSPLVMAEETQPPDIGTAPAAEPAAAGETPSVDTATPKDMATGATEADGGPGNAMPMGMPGMAMKGGMPGGCMGQPGMMGGKGMMGRKGMMGGMPGGPMGGPAMVGSDSMMGGGGSVMHQHYREVMGRLDLLDARLAKIEAMLERLLQR